MSDPQPAWASLIRDVPDFPQPGILFKDITTLIKDGDAFRQVIGALVNRYRGQQIDRVVGVESRGFIFASPLAYELGAGFVPVRKPGKLPADVVKTEYQLEYGSNTLEAHTDSIERGQKVLVVDDVLATGGSAEATVRLVEQLGGTVMGIAVVIELAFLEGRQRLAQRGAYDLFSLLTY